MFNGRGYYLVVSYYTISLVWLLSCYKAECQELNMEDNPLDAPLKTAVQTFLRSQTSPILDEARSVSPPSPIIMRENLTSSVPDSIINDLISDIQKLLNNNGESDSDSDSNGASIILPSLFGSTESEKTASSSKSSKSSSSSSSLSIESKTEDRHSSSSSYILETDGESEVNTDEPILVDQEIIISSEASDAIISKPDVTIISLVNNNQTDDYLSSSEEEKNLLFIDPILYNDDQLADDDYSKFWNTVEEISGKEHKKIFGGFDGNRQIGRNKNIIRKLSDSYLTSEYLKYLENNYKYLYMGEFDTLRFFDEEVAYISPFGRAQGRKEFEEITRHIQELVRSTNTQVHLEDKIQILQKEDSEVIKLLWKANICVFSLYCTSVDGTTTQVLKTGQVVFHGEEWDPPRFSA